MSTASPSTFSSHSSGGTCPSSRSTRAAHAPQLLAAERVVQAEQPLQVLDRLEHLRRGRRRRSGSASRPSPARGGRARGRPARGTARRTRRRTASARPAVVAVPRLPRSASTSSCHRARVGPSPARPAAGSRRRGPRRLRSVVPSSHCAVPAVAVTSATLALRPGHGAGRTCSARSRRRGAAEPVDRERVISCAAATSRRARPTAPAHAGRRGLVAARLLARPHGGETVAAPTSCGSGKPRRDARSVTASDDGGDLRPPGHPRGRRRARLVALPPRTPRAARRSTAVRSATSTPTAAAPASRSSRTGAAEAQQWTPRSRPSAASRATTDCSPCRTVAASSAWWRPHRSRSARRRRAPQASAGSSACSTTAAPGTRRRTAAACSAAASAQDWTRSAMALGSRSSRSPTGSSTAAASVHGPATAAPADRATRRTPPRARRGPRSGTTPPAAPRDRVPRTAASRWGSSRRPMPATPAAAANAQGAGPRGASGKGGSYNVVRCPPNTCGKKGGPQARDIKYCSAANCSR